MATQYSQSEISIDDELPLSYYRKTRIKSKNVSNGKEQKKLNPRKYFKSCNKSNFGRCLIQNCRKTLYEKPIQNIIRHYREKHNMIILPFRKEKTSEQLDGVEIISCNFVIYNEENTTTHCLFINCNYNLEMNVDVIKRHYHEKHKIVLGKEHSHNTLRSKSKEKQKNLKKLIQSPYINLKSHVYKLFNINNYAEYNEENNVSKCLIRNCKRFTMRKEEEYTLKHHYKRMHLMTIGCKIPLEDDEILSDEYGEQKLLNQTDFVTCDTADNSSYQCLFVYCNQVLDKCLPAIKKHYLDKHMVVIGKRSKFTIYRKRKYNLQDYITDNDSKTNEKEILSDDSIKEEEFLSDDPEQ